MSKDNHHSGHSHSDRPYIVLFGLMATAFFIFSFFPEWRVWGFTCWGYFPVWIRLILLASAAALALVTWRLVSLPKDHEEHTRLYVPIAAISGIVLVAAMISLRQETHFLGDGYTLLKWLEDGGAINKIRNFGAQYTLLTLAKVLPTDALGVFRLLAWGAGITAIAVTFIVAARLFEGTARRVLYALGVLSGGYMLLFFGYVENYAVFVLLVLLFCLVGTLGALGKVRPWWGLLPAAGAIIFHIFGVTLVPAATYLVLRDTNLGRRIGQWSRKTRWLVIILAAIAGLISFAWLYTHYYFFRFSFVPIVPNRFTVEGYTLLSAAHLADLVNLIVILVPGILLLVLAVKRHGIKRLGERPVYRFLGLAALGGLGAAFIFDPKLGMPRDWDLFSFAGVPLMVGGMLAALESTPRRVHFWASTMLIIALGLLLLGPRAVIQHTPELAIARFADYRALDPTKNRNGAYFLVDYTRRLGDSAKADQMAWEWNNNLKDQQYLNRGNQLMTERRFREAAAMFTAALKENPVYWVAYTNLAETYLNLGKSDSALEMLRIADGLNPKSPIIMSNLGQMYNYVGQTEKALALWRESAALDPKFVQPRVFLAKYYRTVRDKGNWVATSEEIAALPDAPLDNLAALADYYVSERRFADAAPIYEQALAKGLDTARLREIVRKYPEMGEELPQWKSTRTKD